MTDFTPKTGGCPPYTPCTPPVQLLGWAMALFLTTVVAVNAEVQADDDIADYFIANCAQPLVEDRAPGNPVVLDRFDREQREEYSRILRLGNLQEHDISTFGHLSAFGYSVEARDCFVTINRVDNLEVRSVWDEVNDAFEGDLHSRELNRRVRLSSADDIEIICGALTRETEQDHNVIVRLAYLGSLSDQFSMLLLHAASIDYNPSIHDSNIGWCVNAR